MAQDGKVIFGFDGGTVGGSIDDIVQPPKFMEARNIRPGITAGAPVKSPAAVDRSELQARGRRFSGLAYVDTGESALYMLDAHTRVTPAGAARIPRHDGGMLGYGASRPLKLSSAGITQPGRSTLPPSVAMDSSGGMWTAQIKQRVVRSAGTAPFNGTLGLYVSRIGADGSTVVSSVHVCDVEDSQYAILGVPAWCSITAHGSGAIVWYRGYSFVAVRPICARVLTLSGASLTVGAETVIASPTVACYSPAVASLGGGDAYLAYPSTSTQLTVRRLSSSLASVATYTRTAIDGVSNACCSLWLHPDGTTLVAAVVAQNTALAAVMNAVTLAETEFRFMSTPGIYAMCSALYSHDGATAYYGLAYSWGSVGLPGLSTSTTAYPHTRVELTPVGASTATIVTEIPHVRLASSYAAADVGWRPADITGGADTQTVSSMLAVTPWYGPYSDETDRTYVVDPCIVVAGVSVCSDQSVRTSLHARVAVDRALSRVSANPDGTAIYPAGFSAAGASMQVVSGRFALGYLERSETANLLNEAGLVGRYVSFSTASHQPPVAQVSSGATVIGGALPMYWDGHEASEYMPLTQPVIHVSSTTSGSAASSGTYQYIAVVSWRDACGAIRRSAPSLPVAVTVLSGAPYPDILVTRPLTLHDGGACSEAVCRLYVAQVSIASSVYRLIDSSPDARPVNGCWRFPSPPGVSASSSSAPALYSDGSPGSELTPEPMPPCSDVTVALDRLFAIDAEAESDVLYTKLPQAGIAPEWSGVLRVPFPSQAGRLLALAEVGGQLVALGTGGVSVLYGDGPDSSGRGGFGPPRLISRHGAVSRESVGRYPGGVVYLGADGRWRKLDVQGVATLQDGPRITAPVRAWSTFADGGELVFWCDTQALVYAYELDRWYTWQWSTSVVGGFPYTMTPFAAELSGPSESYMCRAGTGGDALTYFASRIDGAISSAADQAYWRTGWIIPGGDQNLDVEWQQVVIHALSGGSHGLTVQLDAEYGAASSAETQSEVWTSGQIAALADPESGRYTVGIDIVPRKARSIRLRISETGATGTAFRPISCTVYYGVLSKQARRPLKPDGRR